MKYYTNSCYTLLYYLGNPNKEKKVGTCLVQSSFPNIPSLRLVQSTMQNLEVENREGHCIDTSHHVLPRSAAQGTVLHTSPM